MTTELLLSLLRARLNLVRTRIVHYEQLSANPIRSESHLFRYASVLPELRSEQLFLAGLIEQLSEKAVTNEQPA